MAERNGKGQKKGRSLEKASVLLTMMSAVERRSHMQGEAGLGGKDEVGVLWGELCPPK